jgi:lipopolysaccharide/colanic/teichoic acid biosynthesis glycosyltransferase
MRTRFDASKRFRIVPAEDAPQAADPRLRSPDELTCVHARATQPRVALGIKRIIDLTVSLFGLLLFAPVFMAIALAVKFQDGGPVIYRRRVVGQDGEFDAFKFRSMRSDADRWLRTNPILWAEFQQNYKLKNDPRVTRLGRWLRKTSLDELPQLFNVLCGEMSLVGPRMITAAELEKYGDARALLLTVRPGLTGYWQVEGRQTTSYEERVRMDIAYIVNWSNMLDLKILLKTPFAVLRARGAY